MVGEVIIRVAHNDGESRAEQVLHTYYVSSTTTANHIPTKSRTYIRSRLDAIERHSMSLRIGKWHDLGEAKVSAPATGPAAGPGCFRTVVKMLTRNEIKWREGRVQSLASDSGCCCLLHGHDGASES